MHGVNGRTLTCGHCSETSMVLTPSWVILATVCLTQFTEILQRLESVKWSTGRPDLNFIVPAFEFDVRSEIKKLACDSST